MANNVNTVDNANPPNSTLPSPRYNSLPEPVDITRGNKPNILVAVLINTGLIRVLTDSKIASSPSYPSNRTLFKDWYTIKIALLTHCTDQNNKTKHGQYIERLRAINASTNRKPTKPPAPASGTVNRMISGYKKFSNNAAINRYVMSTASRKSHCKTLRV